MATMPIYGKKTTTKNKKTRKILLQTQESFEAESLYIHTNPVRTRLVIAQIQLCDKCDNMVLNNMALNSHFHLYWRGQMNKSNLQTNEKTLKILQNQESFEA